MFSAQNHTRIVNEELSAPLEILRGYTNERKIYSLRNRNHFSRFIVCKRTLSKSIICSNVFLIE